MSCMQRKISDNEIRPHKHIPNVFGLNWKIDLNRVFDFITIITLFIICFCLSTVLKLLEICFSRGVATIYTLYMYARAYSWNPRTNNKLFCCLKLFLSEYYMYVADKIYIFFTFKWQDLILYFSKVYILLKCH